MAIHSDGKKLEVGAGCLISEAFLYLSGGIHLIGWCLLVEVLRYMFEDTHLFFSFGSFY